MGKKGPVARDVQVVPLGQSLPVSPVRVRTLFRRALRDVAFVPVRGPVRVEVEWVEGTCRHTHDEISEAIEAIRDELHESGAVERPDLLDFKSAQRLKATNPHVTVTVVGRMAEGVRPIGALVLTDEERRGVDYNKTGVL